MNKSKHALTFPLVSLLFASFFVLAFAQRPKPTPLPRTIGGEAVADPSTQPMVALNCVSRGQDCEGYGFGCLVMFPTSGWPARIRKTPEVEKQSLSGKAYVTDGTRPSLHYEFTSPPPADVSTFPLDRDIPLDEGVSKSLGYSSVTILKGKYGVDRKMGGFGGLVFNVKVTARIATSPAVGVNKAANTADFLAKACEGKRTNDTVNVSGKDMECPPRIGVREPATPDDIKYFEALLAACKDKKTDDAVTVGDKKVKCPAGITVSSRGTPAMIPAGRVLTACGNVTSHWYGTGRWCCEFRLLEGGGWVNLGCYFTTSK